MDKENKININNAKMQISAVKKTDYPTNNLPEVVLVGKSNVGKSSFINAMLNRNNFARTSNTPGKTRQINFYNIDNKMFFVDLPGYGFSKMSKAEEIKVGKSIEEYIHTRDKISIVLLVIDIRHNLTENDKLMYNYLLKENLPFIVVCNKADKIAKTKVDDRVNELKKELGISYSPIFAFSSEKKYKDIYVKNMWENILEELNLN